MIIPCIHLPGRGGRQYRDAGARDSDLRHSVPEHVHEGELPGPPGLPLHVPRRPPGGGVQHWRHRTHQILSRSQD